MFGLGVVVPDHFRVDWKKRCNCFLVAVCSKLEMSILLAKFTGNDTVSLAPNILVDFVADFAPFRSFGCFYFFSECVLIAL